MNGALRPQIGPSVRLRGNQGWRRGTQTPTFAWPRDLDGSLVLWPINRASFIQVPTGSAIERQLHDQPPASLRADDVLVQTGPTDAREVLEELAGEVVLALPAPEGLGRHAAELTRVLDRPAPGRLR
jgi:hypothetical protein